MLFREIKVGYYSYSFIPTGKVFSILEFRVENVEWGTELVVALSTEWMSFLGNPLDGCSPSFVRFELVSGASY